MRCILASKNLRADSTSDLAVAVDKSNGEGGACGSRGGLHSPWPFVAFVSNLCNETDEARNDLPHDRIPSCSQGISDQSDCIYCAVAWVGNKYAIAAYDDEKEGKRIERSRYPATICCDTRSSNEQETTDRDGNVEKLGCSDAPG